jgi:ParB-like chromosome segregation protein Spo0J
MDELVRFYEGASDQLYSSIRKKGIKRPGFFNRIDPLYVFLSRDGELLWGSGGNHRLAIAKILELEKIPVKIRVCHAEFSSQISLIEN